MDNNSSIEEWALLEKSNDELIISNLGNIKRISNGKEYYGRIGIKGRADQSKVIVSVSLAEAGHKYIYLARAVATAFLPNLHNSEKVLHKDGNVRNCCASNLEWVEYAPKAKRKGAKVLPYYKKDNALNCPSCGQESLYLSGSIENLYICCHCGKRSM